MSNTWTDTDWETLCLAIECKQCTPFLGAGASVSVLPTGKLLARELATTCHYPFSDVENLPRVSQFMAVQKYAPKLTLKTKLSLISPPDFNHPTEIHRVVADLDLPVYITTNYDDFMLKALQRNSRKKPAQVVCQWHNASGGRPVRENILEPPTESEPIVFHLHGTFVEHNSMVLTEDDYLDFLIALTEEPALIPEQVKAAFSNSALLFLGYSLDDLNFKVLFRRMARYMRGTRDTRHVSVQLRPAAEEPTAKEIELFERQREYFERKYDLQDVNVYWGTCEDFGAELRTRLEKMRLGEAV
jgi:hypothetical protein